VSLSPYSCANCGHWQRWFAPPPDCPVCVDVRNALPPQGWHFLTEAQIRSETCTSWTEAAPGVVGFRCTPQLGLGTTGWMIDTGRGLVGWEGAGYYSSNAIAELRRRGELTALGASHVHGYGALWQLQDILAPPILAIGVDDLVWTKAFRVTWPVDERLELASGLVIHHSGGHFAGHNVLHDEHRGILFCGDALKVELDADGAPLALSCHKAFHAQIPLSHEEIRHTRDLFAHLDFEAVATPFEYAAPITTKQVLALFERQLAGQPNAGPIPLSELV
jgi:hypothetical protein